MISIYSSVSKISLHGGKNYTVNGAMTYTIVNDITTIANKLPRMPTLDTIAIMRYDGGRKSRDYTFRPYHVKKALTWLVTNNHLYSNIELEYPSNENWDEIEAIRDAPFLPLTENDLRTIDEDDDDRHRCSDDVPTNTGNCLSNYHETRSSNS